MKKNDLILIIAVAIYSYLFYLQLAGINFLIFSIVLIILLLLKDASLVKNRKWIILAIGAILSAVFVFLHGSTLSIIANIVSLLLLAAISFNRKSSIIAGLIHSLYSEIASIALMVIDIVENSDKRRQEKKPKKNVWIRLTLILAIILIILVMFILYQKANPIFYNFTKDINLDFITFRWIRFTLLGFIILYAFFYQRTFPCLQRYDTNTKGKLNPRNTEDEEKKNHRKFMSIEMERKAGITLLALLNLLILSVNIIDVNYLWAGMSLPEGVTMADALHQAVGTIIFSIIIAITVLLFIFCSDMNFYKKNKLLKILAYLWIIQNVFIVFSTMYRNSLYINEYMLTYKRIGVYVYLTLTLIGIVSVLIKIISSKSNWYLFRFNGWNFYMALVILPAVNWDMFIAEYNLKHSGEIDLNYVFDLSYASIPELVKYGEKNDLTKLKTYMNDNKSYFFDFSDRDGKQISYKNLLDRKIYDFMERYRDRYWKSWCVDRQNVMNELLALNLSGSISDFDLSGNHLKSVNPLRDYTNISKLDLSENYFSDLKSLQYFIKLKTLDLSSNQINDIESIPELIKLEELDLSKNSIISFDSLKKLTNLTKLDISSNNADIKSLPTMKNLQNLNISENKIGDFSFLNEMNLIQTLSANNLKNSEYTNLSLPSGLSELYLSGDNISVYEKLFFENIGRLENLEVLDISKNNLYDLNALERITKESGNKFSKMKTLYISENNLTDISGIRQFSNLEELYASGNKISSIDEIQKQGKIKALYVSNNKIYNIDALADVPSLKTLNISGNPLSDYIKIGALTGLEKLYASKLTICDIKFIESLNNMTSLDLSDNNIEDLTALKKMKKLEWLDISKNPIKEYGAIMGLENLKTLYISNVDDVTLNKIKTALPDTQIYIDNNLINLPK